MSRLILFTHLKTELAKIEFLVEFLIAFNSALFLIISISALYIHFAFIAHDVWHTPRLFALIKTHFYHLYSL